MTTVPSYGKYIFDLYTIYCDVTRKQIEVDLLTLIARMKSEYENLIEIAEQDDYDDFSIVSYFKLIDNKVTLCNSQDDWNAKLEYASDMLQIEELVDIISAEMDTAIQICDTYVHIAEYLSNMCFFNQLGGETLRDWFSRQDDILDRYHLVG
jgi:hypothetical protein